MHVRENLDRLRRQIRDATSTAALAQVVRDLNGLEPNWDNGHELDELRLEALRELGGLSAEDPAAAGLLLDELLPLCLRRRQGRWDWYLARRYDDVLRDWLRQLPEPVHYRQRQAVLDRLLAELDGGSPERACRLIALLGYRSQGVWESLVRLARDGGEVLGDAALHVLVTLGVPSDRKLLLESIWDDRTSDGRWSMDLVGAAQGLPSPQMADRVFARWLTQANLQSADNNLPHLAIAVPATVAEAFPDDSELQDTIWRRLRAVEPFNEPLFSLRVLGSDQIAPPCDSPGVVPFLLSALTRDNHIVSYFRLEECDRPRQLLGWEESLEPRAIEALERDAVEPSPVVNGQVMNDLHRKLPAWQALLCLSRGDALRLVGPAVAGEPSGYAVAEVLDLAACFGLDPLPNRVADLIAGRFEAIDDYAEQISSHNAAIDVARSSGTPEAFEALLGFGVILQDGGILLRLLDSLAEVAASLIGRGDAGVVDRLWAALAPAEPRHRREAAAATLARLVRRNFLRPLPTERLLQLLADPSLDRYSRREMYHSLGFLPAGTLPESLEAELLRAAQYSLDGATNGRANAFEAQPAVLLALARQGLLEGHPHLLRELGLREEGDRWRLPQRTGVAATASVLGALYERSPLAFAPAVADLLGQSDWAAVVQISPFLRNSPRPAPDSVADALIQRIRATSPILGEIDLVQLLADIAPERLAIEDWGELSDWPSQMRAALARTLGRLDAPRYTDRRVRLLVELMGDGQYGVRRCAYRSLARLAPQELARVCTLWATLTEDSGQPAEHLPSLVDLRRRAAEATGWLGGAAQEPPFSGLRSDPEPSVREACGQSDRDLRHRRWAEQYLDRVLTARDNESLLNVWRYGRALVRVGDDETLERLELHRREGEVSAGIRHWVGKLIKELRGRWDEVTRGWSEPWVARRGRLEQVYARLGKTPKSAPPVRCWLWLEPASDLVGVGGWGGWCEESLAGFFADRLFVQGRQAADIIVTRSAGGLMYFSGSGPYPTPGDE